MKTRKIILIAILAITLMFGGNAYVRAAEGHSFNAVTSATKSELNEGETTTVTLTISNINMGEYGISTVEAVLDYDKNIYETVKSSDIQGLNGWSATYNEANGKLLLVLLSATKQDTSVVSVNLKAKHVAQTTNTRVNFKNVTSNDGENRIDIGTVVASIKVIAAETASGETASGDNNQKVDSEGKKVNKIQKRANTAQKSIPYAGNSLVLVYALGGAVILMTITFFRSNRIEK